MRGNLLEGRDSAYGLGSIPAHAGEPISARPFARKGWVYRRACGGIQARLKRSMRISGLSPRMRGNRNRRRPTDPSGGSIPAHAGEPYLDIRRRHNNAVYPRACGGTAIATEYDRVVGGLSPRMRGNLGRASGQVQVDGSIPAHAGEPTRPSSRPCLRWVYPRACGGTRDNTCCLVQPKGLSPRMRGNRRAVVVEDLAHGSIPAHAGEPRDVAFRRDLQQVYPRACGGTRRKRSGSPKAPGLSPRMRGNQIFNLLNAAFHGSIPAHAGEPWTE